MKGHTYEKFEQQIVSVRTLAIAVRDSLEANRILDHKQKAGLQSFLAAAMTVVGEQATAMHRLEVERHAKSA